MRPVRFWIGLVLLTLGLVGLLDASGALDAGSAVSRWWPVAIIGLGLVTAVEQRFLTFGPVVVTAIGVVLLVDRQDWTERSILWPTVLVLLGGATLVGLGRHAVFDHRGIRAGRGPVTGSSVARSPVVRSTVVQSTVVRSPVALFSGTRVRDASEHLTHQEVSAIFGGATLDLREAHIDDAAVVDAFALFGGVQILVPKDWRVSLRGTPVFGGYDDRTQGNGSSPADAPVLTVNATAVFGGVEVANEPH